MKINCFFAFYRPKELILHFIVNFIYLYVHIVPKFSFLSCNTFWKSKAQTQLTKCSYLPFTSSKYILLEILLDYFYHSLLLSNARYMNTVFVKEWQSTFSWSGMQHTRYLLTSSTIFIGSTLVGMCPLWSSVRNPQKDNYDVIVDI